MSISAYVSQGAILDRTRLSAAQNVFAPSGTVRCSNRPLFRSQAARDIGCLLDFDPEVISWSCLPLALRSGKMSHVPDFAVELKRGTVLVDALGAPRWVATAAQDVGYCYESERYCGIDTTHRLANAKDLLGYAGVSISLGDRVRLLACLEEHGPLPLSSCLQVIKNSHDTVGAIAAMVLQRFVTIDLDDAPIGPDTQVSKA